MISINNHTPFQTEALPLTGPDGKMYLSIMVKGTFSFAHPQKITPFGEQLPILYTDEYTQTDSISSIRLESDLVPIKPKADIVLLGSAYAPGGKPVPKLPVRLSVEEIVKTLYVFGNRFYEYSGPLLPVSKSAPEPFITMPITYENAFGGSDPSQKGVYKANPCGKGYILKKNKGIHGTALPNIENPHHLISGWKDRPQPSGFGFIAKSWPERLSFFGRCDEVWLKERMPLPPKDFKEAFYNAAPIDQQRAGYLKGGERIEMIHLSPEPKISFYLPETSIQCTLTVESSLLKAKDSKEKGVRLSKTDHFVTMIQDTLCLMPDEKKYYTVWRGSFPIRDHYAEEIVKVTVETVQ